MDSVPVKAIKLFYCYAREDKLLRDELEKHLSLMRRRGVISAWYDQEILPGEEWKQTIEANLNAADVVLLLVSPDFMNSDYCYSVEMQQALERHALGEISVVPILLRPVDWEDAPFSHLQVLPTEGKPVVSSYWHSRDEAFVNTVNNLRRLITTLSAKTSVSSEIQLQSVPAVGQPKISRVEKLLERGDVFFQRKDYEEALIAYEEVIGLAPDEVRAYKKKSEVLLLLKRYIDVVKLFEQSEELFPEDNEIRKSKGRALDELRRYEEALAVYRQALRVDFNDADAYAGKGRALAGLKRDAEALVAYEQVLQLSPDHVEASIGKGSVLVELKRYAEALVAYEQALQLAPEHIEARIGKGSALRNLERPVEALAYYEQIERLTSGDARFYTGKARVFWDLKRYEDALIAYDNALQIDPDNTDILGNKAHLLAYPLRRKKEGLDLYNKIIQMEPANANNYAVLGDFFDNQFSDRNKEALAAYKRAIQIDPSNAGYYIKLGEVLYQLDRHKEALAAYEQAIRADPNNAHAYFYKGLRLDDDRAEEALAAFSEAARLDPKNVIYQRRRGQTLTTLKRYSEALVAYEKAMELVGDTTSYDYTNAQSRKQEVLQLMEQAEKG